MNPFVRHLTVACALTLAAPLALSAQTPDPDSGQQQQQQDQDQPPPSRLQAAQQAARPKPLEPPPAHIANIEGSVAIERGNQSEDAIDNAPLLVGDRLRAESGHVEVMWNEGTLLRLGRYTDVDVLSPTMIRVTRGRVTITVPNIPGQVVNQQLAIDAPGASARFFSPGIYQILVTGDDEPEVQLGVTHGTAQLIGDGGQVQLADGESSEVKGGGLPSQPEHFLASAADSTYDPTSDLAAFQSASGSGDAYASTSYLPQTLYGYEDVLQSTGTWSSVPTYGYVWFPRVSAGWRPYYRGHWSYLPRYGWTWIGTDKFTWPTHYYGRWGVTDAGAWYWIPSHQWGPAWVAWSISPDYIGWCPLGWNGRPVYSFATVTNTAANFRGSDTYRGWTMVGARNFAYHDVPRYVVERSAIARDKPAFVTQYTAPRAQTYLVPRTGRTSNGSRADARAGAVPRAGITGPSVTAPAAGGVPANAAPPANSANGNTYEGVIRQPEESPYDRALRVMGRRSRPDGMSRDDYRDPGGNDGRSTVAPVLQRDENGVLRPPSGMSGPPGVYAPARGEPRRAGGGDGNGNGNGNGNGRGTQSQSQATGNATSNGNASSSGSATSTGGAVRRGSSGSSASAGTKDTKDADSGSKDGASGASSTSNGTTGKSSDPNNGNGSGSSVPRRRP